ncbi:MAG: IclR family transcriptional regulator, partial [Alphaproteobacteria bacterium]|nr:IclR family transcriptional regulator [Alphaproteobacteria bacterium]
MQIASLGGEASRDGPSDPFRGAGHQRRPSCEPEFQGGHLRWRLWVPIRACAVNAMRNIVPDSGTRAAMGQTAIKALRVLERLVESERPLGVSEIARAGGVAKSNVHRLLAALVATGHARRREDGAYEPTLRMWELGVRVLNRLDLRSVARPHLQALETRTDETVHLTIRAGAEIVYIDKIESHHPVREFTRIGDRAPAHCTATGKVLLAFAAGDVPLPRRLPAFTSATIRDPRRLATELERVRRQGYAFNVGEYGAHVNGVAAPVADHEGKV